MRTTAFFRLCGVLGAGQLVGRKLSSSTPMELAKQGDYSGLVQQLDDLIQAKKRNELAAEYEKRTRNAGANTKTQKTSDKIFDITEKVLLESDTKSDKLLTGDGYTHFDPDYHIAESIQRLREGKNILQHDLILIHHEAMEHDLMNDGGLDYDAAHEIANRSFNYHQALIEWLQKEGK